MTYEQQNKNSTQIFSRRKLLLRGGGLWTSGMLGYGSGTIDRALAYTIQKVEPDETKIYAEAQRVGNGGRPLRVLWLGSGNMNGLFKNVYFREGNEVIALDLQQPTIKDVSAATTYASEHGYKVRFEQGDATHLKFTDGTFDVVVCSMFLCQDFNPEVVVSEIRRVLKPGGRFGFFEHVEDIDKVIVGKVFGERSVIRVQHYPEKFNVMAGVVKKV
jgi:SAM-dependent methyltransferase